MRRAEEQAHKAQETYTSATKKWRVIIVILLILTVAYLWFCTTGDLRFFYLMQMVRYKREALGD